MVVRIGHARSPENGEVNGVAGDQTGKEVCISNWYNSPWSFMAIHPDAAIREKHAKAVEDACVNDNIGYGQSDRNTLNGLAKQVGYDLSKVTTKCNCDCSALQNVAAIASGSGAQYGANGWVTWTMKDELSKLGYKIITDRVYLDNPDFCVRGAIYVRDKSYSDGHTACGLDNGAKADMTLALVDGKTVTKVEKAEKSETLAGSIPNTYTVQPGDTLSGIAYKFLGRGIRYTEIKELNNLTSDVIFPGQVLILPEK